MIGLCPAGAGARITLFARDAMAGGRRWLVRWPDLPAPRVAGFCGARVTADRSRDAFGAGWALWDFVPLLVLWLIRVPPKDIPGGDGVEAEATEFRDLHETHPPPNVLPSDVAADLMGRNCGCDAFGDPAHRCAMIRHLYDARDGRMIGPVWVPRDACAVRRRPRLDPRAARG